MVACQALLLMGFPRQEYWSGLPFPSPGDLPDPVIKPISPTLAGRFLTTKPPGCVCVCVCVCDAIRLRKKINLGRRMAVLDSGGVVADVAPRASLIK